MHVGDPCMQWLCSLGPKELPMTRGVIDLGLQWPYGIFRLFATQFESVSLARYPPPASVITEKAAWCWLMLIDADEC